MAVKPKLAMIPSGVGTDTLYSVLPADGTGDFTFDRNLNTATRVNKDGLIEIVDADVPRLNYPLIDGVVSGCPSLLLEPQRTNLITYSEDFSNSYWTKTRAVVTANQTVSPDGSQTADKYRLDCTSNRSQISRVIYTVGTQYTTSLFVKYDSIQYFYISNAGASAYRVVFDIENGTIISTGSSVDASKIENYGNGWYRCSATFTAAYTTLYYHLSPNSNGATFTNTTDFSYIWGAQIEAGSYPTSYIPTSGSQATRSAETCNNAGDVNTFNDSEGVLFAEISALDDDITNRIISISDGGGSNRILVKYDNSSNLIQASCTVGTDQASLLYYTNDITINAKVLLLYKSNDFQLWVDGFKRDFDVSGLTPSGLDRLNFDNGSGGSDFYGKTKQLQYFDTALTDTDLEELTSWQSFNEMATGQLYTIE